MGLEITNKLNGIKVKKADGNIDILTKGDWKPSMRNGVIMLTYVAGDLSVIRIDKPGDVTSIVDEVGGTSPAVPSDMEALFDIIAPFFFSSLVASGYESPDSSHLIEDPANPGKGVWYPGDDLENIIPDGWRLMSITDYSGLATLDELDLLPTGNFGSPSSYANLWVTDEKGTFAAYYGDTNNLDGTSGIWYPSPVGDYKYPVRLVRESDDGRGADTSEITVSIAGRLYKTKLLSDGQIYLMENYYGLILPGPKRMVLTSLKEQKWEDDIPSEHTHTFDEIPGLYDVDVKRDASNFLPPSENRFVDLLDADGSDLQTRAFTHEAILANIPAGYRLPTKAEFAALLAAAQPGYVLEDYDVAGYGAGNTPMSQAGFDALKAGGSLGMDMNFNLGGGYTKPTELGVQEYGLIDEFDFIQKSAKVGQVYVDPKTECAWWCSDITGGTGWFVKIGNVDAYSGYVTYQARPGGAETAKNYFNRVRLIKDDGVLGDGTHVVDGREYSFVDVGGVIWMAEDYNGSVAYEAAKTLQKIDGELVWV